MSRSIRDERLPAAPELLADAGLELAAELAGEAGTVELVKPQQALYTPRNSLIINYHAQVTRPDGTQGEEVVAAVTDREGLPPGVRIRSIAGGAVAAWRFPDDPVLSCLHRVVDTSALTDMLGYLGLAPHRVNVTPLVYRPTRRAVMRMSVKSSRFVFDQGKGRIDVRPGNREIYLKVVQPARAEQIGRVHDELGEHLPIPRCYGAWSELGLLALEGLPGMTLRDFIRRREGLPPPPEQLVELLDALPATPATEGFAVRSMRRRVRSHERLLRVILPDHAERIRRLGQSLRELPSQRPAVVHGDFYDSQVMVDQKGDVTGLLDLDGVGWGDPADDLASMLGRVWTSGQTPGRGQARFAAYADELLEGFSRRVPRTDLCMRVAAIVFGRSTGPFRSQSDNWREEALERIELAERCWEHARRGVLPD